MNRTKIEWCTHTWNPTTGCTFGCEYCYARKIALRFPKAFPNGFMPTYYPDRVSEPDRLTKPARIFTCSMGDFWDPGITDDQRRNILFSIETNPRHQFLILTKRPENMSRGILYPENLWIGVTVDRAGTESRIPILIDRTAGSLRCHRFVSFEPLLGEVNLSGDVMDGPEWVIIGQQTNPTVEARAGWIAGILAEAADYMIPVFQKDNLGLIRPRQEYPKELRFT